MPHQGFLHRWSRLKAEAAAPAPPATAQLAVPPAVDATATEAALPTLADAAQLDAQSDYSSFVGRGVDAPVRRLAMKKLFADPHFNLVDGLDIYMADYNLPDPVSPAMLAALTHALNVLPRPEDPADPDAPQPPPTIIPDAPSTPSTDQEAA
jgi:hypothetical protein